MRVLNFTYVVTIVALILSGYVHTSELRTGKQQLARAIRSNIKSKNWTAAADKIQQFFEAYKKNSRLRANVLALSQELADAYTKSGTLPYDSNLLPENGDLKNLGMAKDAVVTAINVG